MEGISSVGRPGASDRAGAPLLVHGEPGCPARSDKPACRGFTLIELMIVIAIIGILAMIGISFLQSSRQTAYGISAKHDIKEFATAQAAYFDQRGFFAGAPGESIRNDGGSSDFSVDDFRLSPGVVITVVSGDPAKPYDEADPYTAEAKHAQSDQVWEFNFATQELKEK